MLSGERMSALDFTFATRLAPHGHAMLQIACLSV
jgi:hypothetical protein